MTTLLQLQALGQSPWQDNISRSQLASGALARMVADGDITGLTSNPTIFEQAIGKSDAYDTGLRSFASAGLSAEQIFYALAVEDIQAAADVFQPLYARSKGREGFVSLEVSPRLAHDTAGTISEAQRLAQQVQRPNLMIKIPATRAGLPAITATLAAGISVNVTLIFSLQRYREVIDAHLAGIEQALAAGRRLEGIASVASFFVSRVDSMIDKQLADRMAADPAARPRLQALRGRAAIANARLAYQLFSETMQTPRWKALAASGAQPQRPLWASTSTKDPAYRDVLYVEQLIGPQTVNTLPPATLQAFKDHGNAAVTLHPQAGDSQQLLQQLAAAGIDLQHVTEQLEADGVAAFQKSFDSLLAVIEQRRTEAPAAQPAN